ncbi:MAG TPA: response regulator receiver protein, partial [Kandleria vitulina]|nr:response regulator receiver protein [Kandleria vitulina]
MYKVLVADDEKIGRKGVHFLLDQMEEELSIVEAKNGKEALHYIENNPIDILLTDIKMPFIDGIELIGEALKIQPHIKIAIFSGYSDFEYAKKALSLGVMEYILKPVNPEEFKSTIKKVIHQVDMDHQRSEQSQRNEEILKEHVLYNLVNGNNLKAIEKQLNGKSIEDYIAPYHSIILLEFPGTFFDQSPDIQEDFKKHIRIPFDYLNLNLSQSLFFFEEEDND